MTFRHGSRTAVLFDIYDISTYMNAAQSSSSVSTAETTTYGATGDAKTYITGHRDTTISVSGLWDGDTGALDEIITGTLASDTDENFLIAEDGGLTLGRRCIFGQSNRTKYSTDSPVADVVKISLDLQTDEELGRGVLLTNAVSSSGSIPLTNTTPVDNGAATSNGGTAVLFNTVNTRNGNTQAIKIQHSADSSTWVDLVSFTTIPPNSTTPNSPLRSQRAVVAPGTTVNRYLRCTFNPTGTTGSIVLVLAFSRR